jgi:hypothetical protein
MAVFGIGISFGVVGLLAEAVVTSMFGRQPAKGDAPVSSQSDRAARSEQ